MLDLSNLLQQHYYPPFKINNAYMTRYLTVNLFY